VTAVAAGYGYTCALLSTGTVKCWGGNWGAMLGDGTTADRATPVEVSGLNGVTAISATNGHTCALLSTGAVKCWGGNGYGELGVGTTTPTTTPVQTFSSGATGIAAGHNHACAVVAGGLQCWGKNAFGGLGTGQINGFVGTPTVSSYGLTNGALIGSQASVLVQKFIAASASTISGHVTPIAYTMVNSTTGNQALMVTYDPLAAAAAMFIEQYQAHVDACNATTGENTATGEALQQAGAYLWACSNPTAKTAYLSGMAEFLKGAKMYLFGHTDAAGNPDGSATAPCTGTTTPAYCIDSTKAHLPYTFVVPNYTEAAFNPEYYGQLDAALGTYRTAIFGSTASGLHKSLQLAGIIRFDTDTSAIVTTRVKRSGAFGASCTAQ
jgi:hypothetical protein